MIRTLSVAALALAVSAPQVFASAIAQIKAAEGEVEVLRNGRWRRAREGTELTIKDSVRTGENALAQIEFYDADGDSGAVPTQVDLVPGTEVSIEHFEISKSLPRQRQGLIDVAKGYLRAFTKGWATGSVFSVKAGTTVCGIRGSIADIGYNPQTGQATFTSLDGTMFHFQAGTLPEGYNQMDATAKQNVFDALVKEAIRLSIRYGTDIAAGRDLPAGVYQMSVADKVIAEADSDRQVIQLTQKQKDGLAAVTAAKAANTVINPEGKKVAGTGDGGKKVDENEYEKNTVSSLLNAITQELVSDNTLNAPASKQ